MTAATSPLTGPVVIRLVYDGPPRSGKTTTLEALAGSLARPLVSPEQAEGRTLFFDWVEYTGGSFEGQPIRCQIVSVPGQRALARRRRALLETADVVVLVANTTAAGLAETEECLASLRAQLEQRSGPPIGVVLQANKRDLPGAMPIEELRDRLGARALACVESVATEGMGTREAFVLAVRLALDRVRELMAAHLALRQPLAAESAEELLAQVKAREAACVLVAAGGTPPAAALLREVLVREDVAAVRGAESSSQGEESPTQPPALPDSAAPSGRVWPPIEGRMLLHEAANPAAVARRQNDGAWVAEAGSFRFHSLAAHRFGELEQGKLELLHWARLHAAGFERLSPRRCLVLADAGAGSWRLWQVVLATESLQRRLANRLLDTDAREAARALLSTAACLVQARLAFATQPRLPCRLGAIGLVEARVVYAGLLPPASWRAPAGEHGESEAALIRREIAPVLRKFLPASRLDVAHTLDALQQEQAPTSEGRRICETVSALLIAG